MVVLSSDGTGVPSCVGAGVLSTVGTRRLEMIELTVPPGAILTKLASYQLMFVLTVKLFAFSLTPVSAGYTLGGAMIQC